MRTRYIHIYKIAFAYVFYLNCNFFFLMELRFFEIERQRFSDVIIIFKDFYLVFLNRICNVRCVTSCDHYRGIVLSKHKKTTRLGRMDAVWTYVYRLLNFVWRTRKIQLKQLKNARSAINCRNRKTSSYTRCK